MHGLSLRYDFVIVVNDSGASVIVNVTRDVVVTVIDAVGFVDKRKLLVEEVVIAEATKMANNAFCIGVVFNRRILNVGHSQVDNDVNVNH